MARWNFTVTVLNESTEIVTVEADTEEDARRKAKAADFVFQERLESGGIRSVEIDTFDGMDDVGE
jgi:hypothetical protein